MKRCAIVLITLSASVLAGCGGGESSTSAPASKVATSSSVAESTTSTTAPASRSSSSSTRASTRPSTTDSSASSLTPSGHVYRIASDDLAGFSTANGRVHCSIDSSDLSCGLSEGGWSDRPTSVSVATSGATSPATLVTMTPSGDLNFAEGAYYEAAAAADVNHQSRWWTPSMGTAEASGMGVTVAVLPTGDTITNGTFSCTRNNGFVCSGPTGKTIRVNSAGVSVLKN